LDKTHTVRGKQSLILSIIGFVGAFFVPILGTIDTKYWSDLMSGEIDLVFFHNFFYSKFYWIDTWINDLYQRKRQVWVICAYFRFIRISN